MTNGKQQRESEEGTSVTLTCYRVSPGEGEAPQEGMNTYSVMVLLPNGEFKHQVVWARNPDDVGDAIRVPSGTRVIITQMADILVWDSGPAEPQAMEEAAPTP